MRNTAQLGHLSEGGKKAQDDAQKLGHYAHTMIVDNEPTPDQRILKAEGGHRLFQKRGQSK